MSQDETPETIEDDALETAEIECTETDIDSIEEQETLQAETEEIISAESTEQEVLDDEAIKSIADESEELLAGSVDAEVADDSVEDANFDSNDVETLDAETDEVAESLDVVEEDSAELEQVCTADAQESDEVDQVKESDAAILPSELHVSLIDSLHEQLKASYDNAVDNQIILDCSEVEDVDSACIQLLTAFQCKAQANELSIDWRSVPQEMQKVTKNLGLSSVLTYESNAGQEVSKGGGSVVSGDDLLMF